MVNELSSFCRSNNIAIKKRKFLLAVSGGIDSVVLAHLFNQLGVDFGIAHCNFSLRGKESDEDERFVKNLASSLNCTFHHTKFDTLEFAKSERVSIQMAARDLRYSWFEEIRKTFDYDYISTAHHKGDVVETILFNLTKGTGLDGLHGIKAISNKLIRPLLFASRIQINSYAKKNNISWREDGSNASVKYSRNNIRHRVIPMLEELNPKAQESIYSTSERIRELELFLAHNLEILLKELLEYQNGNTIIKIDSLTKVPGYGYMLHKILQPFGYNYTQAKVISNNLEGLSGRLHYSTSHVINIDRNQLIISPLLEHNISEVMYDFAKKYSIGKFRIETNTLERKEFTIENNRNILALDKSKLTFPLEIRNWRIGDVFYPLGMKGKKKLSDFMIDAKIPVNLKKEVLVIVSKGNIVGVLGHRLDDRFKITSTTKNVFEITVHYNYV